MRYSNHLSGINLGIFVIYNIIQIRNAVLILNRIILLLQYRLLRSNGASVIVLI